MQQNATIYKCVFHWTSYTTLLIHYTALTLHSSYTTHSREHCADQSRVLAPQELRNHRTLIARTDEMLDFEDWKQDKKGSSRNFFSDVTGTDTWAYKGSRLQVEIRIPYIGWGRPTACRKLQVIFHKRATNYRDFWRKMTCKDKASYGSSPPCTYTSWD